MLCGGLTVFAPMLRFGVKEGTKVGIAGLGGLGHCEIASAKISEANVRPISLPPLLVAVQFAKALGAEVTVFSHQADKEVS